MVDSLTFLCAWRGFRSEECFAFSTLTALVGDQGSGKSSLVVLLVDLLGGRKIPHSMKSSEIATLKYANTRSSYVRWYDAEKHNIRAKTYIDNVAEVQARFLSHGQVHLPLVLALLDERRDTSHILLLDEPECGLSPRSCERVAVAMQKAAGAGVQVIAATHSPVIAAVATRTIDLDAR